MREDLSEKLRTLIDARCGGGPSGPNYDPELLEVLTEAAAALEAAREDASRWRERYVAQLACYRQDLHGDMANDSIERAEKAADRIAMLDQARGKGVAE